MSSVTFSTSVGGDGSTVTDDNNATTGLRDGGWKTRFVPALTQEVAVAAFVVTKAGEASTSATNASASATSAASSYDSFDDRYLGAKSTNPTLDNDSATLLIGAIYWNATANEMRVWSGSAWISYNPAIAYLALTGGTLSGNLGIGASAAGVTLAIAKTLSGAATSRFVWVTAAVASDVTSQALGFATNISTQAAAFTLPILTHYLAVQGAIGTDSAITNQYGFQAASSLVGALSNNYGFYGVIAAGTGRYNLYMGGTAANYLAGDLQLSKTVTTAGTVGAQTIDKTTGSVNFAAAAASLVVTNSLVTTASVIIATVGTNDATMKSVLVVATAGSFTIYANVAATAETRVNFHVTN